MILLELIRKGVRGKALATATVAKVATVAVATEDQNNTTVAKVATVASSRSHGLDSNSVKLGVISESEPFDSQILREKQVPIAEELSRCCDSDNRDNCDREDPTAPTAKAAPTANLPLRLAYPNPTHGTWSSGMIYLTERIRRGEDAIAKAKAMGRDVNAWEAHLRILKEQARTLESEAASEKRSNQRSILTSWVSPVLTSITTLKREREMPYRVQLPPDLGKKPQTAGALSLRKNSGDGGDDGGEGIAEGPIKEEIRPEPEAASEMPSVPVEAMLAEHSNAEINAIIDVWRRLFGFSESRAVIRTHLKRLGAWQGRRRKI